MSDDETKQYVVWSNQMQAWEAGTGYTPFFSEASRYTHDRAFAVCLSAIPPGVSIDRLNTLPEVPVLAADIDALRAVISRA
jgi:hypothetical protein